MATIVSSLSNSSLNKTISNQHLSRSLERALDEATATGDLNLPARKLRDFPNVKCDLSDTITADLSRNRFAEFPRILCSLFSLERLNLYHNAIKSIPEQIVQIHMLKILNLSRNQLTFIPSSLCKLPNLEVLIFNNNKLISLPEEIGQLVSLIELDVSSNDIAQIPYQIGSLSSLRTLNLRRNIVTELPIEICQLKLIHFDCSFNRITHLPLNLREMISLIEFNVENNPLESPPASICSLGLLHIMRFLLVEAMKEEKRRGLLTENEINTKYRNSFSYQGSRDLQCGMKMMKTVVPSDSGYLTTESSEKTLGDDDSILSLSNEQTTVRSEPTLSLTLADEFSKELSRQKNEYEKKKDQAYQLKVHLLQQMGENESQRAKTREQARRVHDEQLALIEKQREGARRKMENSKNIQLFTFSSTDSDSSSRSSRSLSVEPNSIAGGKEMRMNYGHTKYCLLHQRSLPTEFKSNSDDDSQIKQMKNIIEERLKVTLPDDLAATLSDGVVLCHFINQIRPRSVQSIHVPSQAVPKLSLAKCRRNLENFLEASRRLGVPETDLCSAQDLIDEVNLVQLIRHIQCLIDI